MKYSYRRIRAWHFEVIRKRDNKLVATFVRGSYQHWYILSAGDDRIIADHLPYLHDVKEHFEAYAKRRRGQI